MLRLVYKSTYSKQRPPLGMKTAYSYFILNLLIGVFLVAVTTTANAAPSLFVQLKQYANLANAAYFSEQQAQAVIKAQGYRLEQYNNVPGVEVSYFIATNDVLKHQIIAVRGSANVENAIVNLSLKLLPDAHAGIALHQGFAQAAEGIYKMLLPKLNKNYTVSTTGHSLGGAIAVILAMYLDIDRYTLGPIITFGQPKLTNITGATLFRHLNIIRVVTPQDVVPLVPPLDFMDINNIDIYWHLGKEVVLLEERDYAVLEGVKSMMRAGRIINTTLGPANIEYHNLGEYLHKLELKTKAANMVPYETEINLFNLFGG